MELSLFNNKTTVNAHSQLLAVQQQQIHQAATAIDIYRHNKGNIGGGSKLELFLEKWNFLMENTFSVKEKSNLVAPGSDYDISTPPSLFSFNLTPAEPQTENGNREAKPISIKLTLPV